MTVVAYYNEIDPFAAQWLRNLIAGGHIAPGDVDERSIVDVRPDDLAGYTQAHFFAGIGGWSLALRLAGWPDNRSAWTGSCPCQPFSAAGKRKGTADARHLWPEFRRLIAECDPPVVFGEQVASKDGRSWLAGVRADLEDMAYAVGAADMCAASVGAPHIRQRLWWVADAGCERRDGIDALLRPEAGGRLEAELSEIAGGGGAGGVADAGRLGGKPDGLDVAGAPSGAGGEAREREWLWADVGTGGNAGRVADASGDECRPGRDDRADGGRAPEPSGLRAAGGMGDADDAGPQGRHVFRHGAGQRSPWEASWLGCTDGKARRVEPGTFPLAHGVSNRVGRLRAYGNAIVPQVAAEFIGAFIDIHEDYDPMTDFSRSWDEGLAWCREHGVTDPFKRKEEVHEDCSRMCVPGDSARLCRKG